MAKSLQLASRRKAPRLAPAAHCSGGGSVRRGRPTDPSIVIKITMEGGRDTLAVMARAVRSALEAISRPRSACWPPDDPAVTAGALVGASASAPSSPPPGESKSSPPTIVGGATELGPPRSIPHSASRIEALWLMPAGRLQCGWSNGHVAHHEMTELQCRLLVIMSKRRDEAVRWYDLNEALWPHDPKNDQAIQYHARNIEIKLGGKIFTPAHGRGLCCNVPIHVSPEALKCYS